MPKKNLQINSANLVLVLVCQACHDGIIYWMNIGFEIKTITLYNKAIHVIRKQSNNGPKSREKPISLQYLGAQHGQVLRILLMPQQ